MFFASNSGQEGLDSANSYQGIANCQNTAMGIPWFNGARAQWLEEPKSVQFWTITNACQNLTEVMKNATEMSNIRTDTLELVLTDQEGYFLAPLQ